MDYNKIKTFQVVATKQSVSLAAKALHRTQSAISQQVTNLEKELGLMLLERRGGRVYLTKEGKALFERTQKYYAAIDESILETKGELGDIDGDISIGISPSHCNYLLAPRLIDFKREFPKVQIEFRMLDDAGIETQLAYGALDFGVVTLFRNRNLFAVDPLFAYEEYPFGGPEYVKKVIGNRKAVLQDLFSFRLLDFSRDFLCFAHWLSKNSKPLVKFLDEMTPAYVVRDHEIMKSLLMAKAGIAMLPTYIVRREEAKGSLIRVFPNLKPTQVSVDIAYRKKNNFRRFHHDLLEYLLGARKNLRPSLTTL